MKIRPLHDRILVKREEEKEVKKGGIIIPDTAKEKPQEGKVIAVGKGEGRDAGEEVPRPTLTKAGGRRAKGTAPKYNNGDLGAQMVKEAAPKPSDIAGDGTTTATVLPQAIARDGMKNVTAGANPMGLKRGIDKAVDA